MLVVLFCFLIAIMGVHEVLRFLFTCNLRSNTYLNDNCILINSISPLYPPRISTVYQLYVHYVFSVSPPYLHHISTIYPIYLHHISTISPPYFYHIPTISPLYLRGISIVCPSYLHHISTIFQQYLLYISTISLPHLIWSINRLSGNLKTTIMDQLESSTTLLLFLWSHCSVTQVSTQSTQLNFLPILLLIF